MSECEEMVGVEKNSVGYFYCDQKLIQDSGLFFERLIGHLKCVI